MSICRSLCRKPSTFCPTDIEAVVISTPTETHSEYIERAAKAGKAIFCEKPVSLDLARASQALQIVKECKVPFQIGFDRRFDPGHSEVKRQIAAGALGQIDQFLSVSRDPAELAAFFEGLSHAGALSPNRPMLWNL
jgi:myo-inositol 2-dehydrogenase / D-chiro-inositol 1-dehydrogenase